MFGRRGRALRSTAWATQSKDSRRRARSPTSSPRSARRSSSGAFRPPTRPRTRSSSSTSSTARGRARSGASRAGRSSRRSHLLDASPPDALREGYPLLVRALANIALCYVPGDGVLFTTMERGSYLVPAGASVDELAARRRRRGSRRSRSSRLVIDNEFRTDLEPELWGGDETARAEIAEAGRRLDALGLLPAPFPIEDLVDERDLRHIKRLYGIGGLSYGNLSARKDETRFWMSASGVDKSKLEMPGRDILLVSGYDAEAGRIVLSVPPGHRAAARLGRRDRALDDLPGASRRRTRSSTSTRGSRASPPPRSTTRAAPRSWPRASPSCSPPSPIRRTPSSACGTTASPRRARASSEILDRVEPRLLVQVPMS